MRLKKAILVLALGFFFGAKAFAGNDALAQIQPVPAGERVASYLQSMMNTACAILVAQKPGDLINGPEIYSVGVIYNPDEKVIDVSVVGTHADVETARQKLGLTQKLILSFNKKIQKYFGMTLSENDLNMDYLDAKTSKIILKYRAGNYLEGSASSPKPSPTAQQKN